MAEAATLELNNISRTIRSAMGEGAGSFKQAASNSNSVLSKIAKDLSSVFATQRKDTFNLSNTMDEVLHESEQTSMKMDRLHSVFQETISLQTNMLGELRNLSGNIKILNDSFYDLNKNISAGNQSLLGGIGEVATGIAGLAVGAGAVVGGAHMLRGGGGDTSNFQWGTGPENVNMKAVAESIKDVESKGSGGYKAQNSKSSASGAYQFINSTWQSAAKNAGIGTEYKRAVDAPPEVQDAVFNDYFQRLVKKEGLKGAVLTHFLGPGHKMPQGAQSYNITPDSYLSRFEKSYGKYSSSSSFAQGETKTDVTPSTSGGSTTTQATPMTAPMGGTEQLSHSHPGIISGAMGGSEGVSSGALPHSDIVALGNSLQKMGLRISEHPSFGGVQGKHVKGSAHYDGRAIDINVGNNMVEANDPVWGKKFDQLADQLSASGYKVLWRTSGKYGYPGHDNHLHVQVGRGTSGHENEATPMPSTNQGMAAMNAAATQGAPYPESSATATQGSPMPQTPLAPMVSGVPIGPQGMNPMMMMGAMGGMGGGIGGIVGTLAPLLISALSSGMGQQLEGQPSSPAEMIQPITNNKLNNQVISETAIQKEAQQENMSQAQQTNSPDNRINPNTMAFDGEGYNYNGPEDTSWPSWASMLGGNHYKEMKNGIIFNLIG